MGEAGQKGFYDVTMSKQETALSFVPVSVIQFDRIVISCVGLTHMNEVLDACREAASDYARHYGAAIVELEFVDVDAETADLFNEIAEDELLETVREAVEANEDFVWVHSITVEDSILDLPLSPFGEQIIHTMKEWNTHDWKEVLNDLYRHPKGSRFLDTLDSRTIEELQDGAVQKIRRGMQVEE